MKEANCLQLFTQVSYLSYHYILSFKSFLNAKNFFKSSAAKYRVNFYGIINKWSNKALISIKKYN